MELESGFRGLALALSSSFLFSGMAFGSALGGIAFSVLTARGKAAQATMVTEAMLQTVKAAKAECRPRSAAVVAH